MRFRRLLGYIMMVLTVILTIGFNTQYVVGSKTNTMEFSKGTELVYSITKRDNTKYDSTYYPNTAREPFSDLSEIDIESKVMERLDQAGVRNAEVSVVKGTSDNKGYQLKVNFSPLSTNELNNVKSILSMTGSLSIVVTGDDYYFTMDRNELFGSKVADLIYDGTTPYPAINIGNKDDYETLVDEAKKAYENHKMDTTTDSNESSDSASTLRPNVKKADGDDSESGDDSSEEDEKAQGTVYLWMNKTVDDTFDLAYGKNSKFKVDSVANKVLVPLYTSDYDSDTMKWKIPSDKDGNAFNISTARAFVTMLNATDYGFDIQYLYQNSVAIPFGKNASNVAVISFAICLAIISIILIALYGIAGFSAAISLFATAFFSLTLFNLLGFEFSVAGIVGLVFVCALSVFMSVNYLSRVNIELKKGRRVEKANKEGFRKSVLLSLDITVISFLGSLFSFLVSKGMYKTFLGMSMVGSLIAFLITVFLNYGLMYFLAKGVSYSKIPFFGFDYKKLFHIKNKENKKAKKDVDFATCKVKSKSFVTMLVSSCLPVLLLAVALPTFYASSNGERMFNNSDDYKNSYVLNITYRMDGNKYEDLETDKNYLQYIKDIGLNSVYGNFFALEYGEEVKDEYKDKNYPVFYYNSDDCHTSLLEKSDEENNVYYVKYFSLTVDRDISNIVLDGGNTIPGAIAQSMKQEAITSNDVEIKPGLSSYFTTVDFAVNCFVETPIVITYNTNNLMLLVFLFSLFASIYTLCRYGINIFLSQVTYSSIVACFITALLAITRLPYNAYTGFALIAAVMVANVISVLLLAKNKEVLKERGLKGVATNEEKALIINHVFKEALPSSIAIICSSIILIISTVFINSTLISGMSLFIIATIPLIALACYYLLPFFYILTTHISFAYFKKKYESYKAKRQQIKENAPDKNKDVIYVDEDGPHETIIVGMNDFKF
mgnify:FL=1